MRAQRRAFLVVIYGLSAGLRNANNPQKAWLTSTDTHGRFLRATQRDERNVAASGSAFKETLS